MSELDQSQRAAEPLKPMEASELLRRMKTAGIEVANEEAAEALDENRKQAAIEISSIFALRDNPDFAWYEREFVDKPYEAAFDKLRNPAALEPGETLELVQARYIALRTVKAEFMEREIIHRELIDPQDEQIPKLRAKLRAL